MTYRHHHASGLIESSLPSLLHHLPLHRWSDSLSKHRNHQSQMWRELLDGRSKVNLGWGGSSTLIAQTISLLMPPMATCLFPRSKSWATGKLADFVARLFSEVGSSTALHLLSPMTSLSLCLGGAGLACYFLGVSWENVHAR